MQARPIARVVRTCAGYMLLWSDLRLTETILKETVHPNEALRYARGLYPDHRFVYYDVESNLDSINIFERPRLYDDESRAAANALDNLRLDNEVWR